MVNRDKCPPCGISWPWLCPTSSFHVGWLWAWPTGKLTYSGTGLFQTKPLASYFQMITPNAIGWIFMSSKHSSVEILTFVVMDLRSGAFGRWRFSCMVMRGESSWTSLVPLWKRPQRASSPLLPREDTARRQPSMNQEASPRQTLNLPVLWSWTSQLSELWKTQFCCVSHAVWVFLLQQPEQTETQGKERQCLLHTGATCNNAVILVLKKVTKKPVSWKVIGKLPPVYC